jgi:hypothetical protein
MKEGILPEMMFNKILVTAEKKKSTSKLILPGVSDNVYSTTQEVIKVGPQVAQIEPGNLVEIMVNNFAVRKTNSIKDDLVKEYHEVSLPIEEFGDVEYMIISDRDVKYFWKDL